MWLISLGEKCDMRGDTIVRRKKDIAWGVIFVPQDQIQASIDSKRGSIAAAFFSQGAALRANLSLSSYRSLCASST